ncbi:hypothetical protein J6590_092936 [Homalodisca vitripennis]|nr:hypothetical protein J6590_092936 [Homalodisca vitripennis]
MASVRACAWKVHNQGPHSTQSLQKFNITREIHFVRGPSHRMINPTRGIRALKSTRDEIREFRAKKPSLTLNLGSNGLKVTSVPQSTAGQAGCLQRSPIQVAATLDVA